MKCGHCGRNAALPFRCVFCGEYFCVEHRLPESHSCPELWKAKMRRVETRPYIAERESERVVYEYAVPRAPRTAHGALRFSATELKHLAIGALLVLGVVTSFFLFTFKATPTVVMSLAALLILSFLLHELAHKLVAQRRGLWAEFRLNLIGVLLTLFSVVTPIKIISPGSVNIVGPMSATDLGRVCIAGPLTNIALSTLFVGVTPLLQGWIVEIAILGGFLNAFMALFNLIPLGLLDGLKVFRWNKKAWALAFIISAALSALTFA